MFIEGGQHHERTVRECTFPPVELDDDAVHTKQQVVVWFLKCLGDRVEFTFVRAAVVRLRLAGNRAHEVRVHTHREAEHVHRLDDVGGPVAAFLVGLYLVDNDVMVFMAVGRDIESREPGFAAVLHAGKEVEDVLLLLNDALLLLLAVGNRLRAKELLPVFCGYLNVVFNNVILCYWLLGQNNTILLLYIVLFAVLLKFYEFHYNK